MLFDDGVVALVTGASKGIGRACAVDLAREGATVVVNYSSSPDAAEITVKEVEAVGGTALAVRADVGDERAVRGMFRTIRQELGRIDVLVNNAGITRDGFVMMMGTTKWDDVIRTNLSGAFFTTREALKLMSRQASGSIVNVSSLSGIAGQEGQVNYSASKGGLIAMTKAVAREAASFGVRANVVAPGFIETEMLRTIPAHLLSLYTQLIPLRRIGEPDDVAAMVTFLASRKAKYITGKVFVVDGGLAID